MSFDRECSSAIVCIFTNLNICQHTRNELTQYCVELVCRVNQRTTCTFFASYVVAFRLIQGRNLSNWYLNSLNSEIKFKYITQTPLFTQFIVCFYVRYQPR